MAIAAIDYPLPPHQMSLKTPTATTALAGVVLVISVEFAEFDVIIVMFCHHVHLFLFKRTSLFGQAFKDLKFLAVSSLKRS